MMTFGQSVSNRFTSQTSSRFIDEDVSGLALLVVLVEMWLKTDSIAYYGLEPGT